MARNALLDDPSDCSTVLFILLFKELVPLLPHSACSIKKVLCRCDNLQTAYICSLATSCINNEMFVMRATQTWTH